MITQMTSIDIDPKYRLGLDQVDREHAQLIRIADDLKDLIKDQKASGESIQRITGELIRYTETHFDSEERLMAEKNYPGLHTGSYIENCWLRFRNLLPKPQRTDQAWPSR